MRCVFYMSFKFIFLALQTRLELKEHPDLGVYVKDLTMVPVHSVVECEKVMAMGHKNRSVISISF